jgi:hypothetical protein
VTEFYLERLRWIDTCLAGPLETSHKHRVPRNAKIVEKHCNESCGGRETVLEMPMLFDLKECQQCSHGIANSVYIRILPLKDLGG